MKQKIKNLSYAKFRELFPYDDVCLGIIFNMKYGGTNLTCAKCNTASTYYRVKTRKCYECGSCRHQLYPLAGTMMEGSTTDLTTWFYAIYMFSTSKNGVSAKELERALGVTYKTAWRIGHKIRETMGKGEDRMMKGVIEIDEALIGGVVHGGKRGWGAENKTCLFGIMERGGKVKVTPVENRERNTIFPLINKHVEKGSTVNSDEFKSYHTLGDEGYDHRTVIHSKYQWAQGENYTNSIEGYWSNLKKSILGTHTYVSPKHMQKYLDEFDFRHNHRSNEVIFNEILKRVV
jgi:transposase